MVCKYQGSDALKQRISCQLILKHTALQNYILQCIYSKRAIAFVMFPLLESLSTRCVIRPHLKNGRTLPMHQLCASHFPTSCRSVWVIALPPAVLYVTAPPPAVLYRSLLHLLQFCIGHCPASFSSVQVTATSHAVLYGSLPYLLQFCLGPCPAPCSSVCVTAPPHALLYRSLPCLMHFCIGHFPASCSSVWVPVPPTAVLYRSLPCLLPGHGVASKDIP